MNEKFAAFVKAYMNNTFAWIGKTVEAVASEFSVSAAVVQSWIVYCQQHQAENVAKNGPYAILTNESFIELYNADHPPAIVIHTPFGDVTKPLVDVNSKTLLISMTDGQLMIQVEALLQKYCGGIK
jgi:hypothetical protein